MTGSDDVNTDCKRYEEGLALSVRQLRALSLRLLEAREQERVWAARRIHDELGQVLTALRMQAGFLGRQIPPERDDLRAQAQSVVDLVTRAIRTVQVLCTELRPRVLDDFGIGAALEWQAAEFARRTGAVCSVDVEPEDLELDRERSTAAFRIFQEALADVARHAGTRRVQASLARDAESITLTVVDDGRDITVAQAEDPQALGLLQIRERLAPFGGSLVVDGAPGGGTRLTVTLPLADSSAVETPAGRAADGDAPLRQGGTGR